MLPFVAGGILCTKDSLCLVSGRLLFDLSTLGRDVQTLVILNKKKYHILLEWLKSLERQLTNF